MTNTVDQFREAMHQVALIPPVVIEGDGLLHRFHVEGDRRGTLNGWYCLHLDGRAAGVFGNWKTGLRTTWAAAGRCMSTAERDAFAELIEAERTRAQAERRIEHEARAAKARAQWAAAHPADPMHPYLIAKGVMPHSLRQAGGALLVPLFDVHGQLWNVQRIQADGTKRFRPGRASGLFSPIGDLCDPARILICEGWATGATLHEESGNLVLCAMNAGNLLAVARAARSAWPGAELVICADNDRHTPSNPGVTAATEAAKATGARLLTPEFPEGADGTDFNDLAALRRKVVA